MGDLLEIVEKKTDQSNLQSSKQKKLETIDLKQLINRLNYVNFQDGTLTSVFHHKNYNRSISLDIKPVACKDNELSCLWPDYDNLQIELKNYDLTEIYIDDGISTIVISPENVNFKQEGFTVQLPEVNILKPARKSRRYSGGNTQVQMIQNSVLFRGKLINFTSDSIRIEIQAAAHSTANRLNPDAPVSITLLDEGEIKFSGECTIIRTSREKTSISCVLKPINNRIQKFKAKEYRSFRQKLIPSPSIVFTHPFTGNRVNLPVYDLSGAGFSVEEDQRSSTLLPGMIISELEIVLSTGMNVKCKCQVLYRRIVDEDEHKTIFLTGFVILDIKPYDHVQLLSIIFLARNSNIYLSMNLDTNALWRFLFESGFIYPTKYEFLKSHKEKIKSIYKKIYTNAPDIARHITYQDKGEILGHGSMLRSYENTWLIHHHATLGSSKLFAGLYVLEQFANYAYNTNKIDSLHMNYLLCYYRPENRFPARAFGGAAKSVNNPKGCSEDNFVYYEFQINTEKIFDDLNSWSLAESSDEDLLDLQSYYEEVSGGLMLDALNILPGNSGSTGVIKAYEKLQLKREIKLYSLKSKGDLLAVFIADIADTGMNMSELTNNIKVIVVQPDNLTKKMLESSINEIAKNHYDNSTHVLLYPDSYADNNLMKYDKKYRMWIYNIDYSDAYFDFLNKILRFSRK